MATKLINMKLPPPQKKTPPLEEVAGEQEQYPYGLKLRFEKGQINKIDSLQKIEVGATVGVNAIGKVTEVRVADSGDGRKRHSVEIQIHEIDIVDKASFNAAFKEAAGK